MMKAEEQMVGIKVKSNREFTGVPKGTEGIIDEVYNGGVMVAWDLPDRPLPKGYTKYDGKPQVAQGTPLRDGFSFDDLKYLDRI